MQGVYNDQPWTGQVIVMPVVVVVVDQRAVRRCICQQKVMRARRCGQVSRR